MHTDYASRAGKVPVPAAGGGIVHEDVVRGNVEQSRRNQAACENAARGQEAMTRKRLGEDRGPMIPFLWRFGLSGGARHPLPGLRHCAVDRRAIWRLEPVLHIPDLVGEHGHGAIIRVVRSTAQVCRQRIAESVMRRCSLFVRAPVKAIGTLKRAREGAWP